MAALIQHVRTGQLSPADTVVFLHTGGMPAVFTESFVNAFARSIQHEP
jgi:1-aminocyclopropane-1-carboxylate deaminase/D-cysteine desulfhydrase-like pyridoxal-dependent ACC family enzyme